MFWGELHQKLLFFKVPNWQNAWFYSNRNNFQLNYFLQLYNSWREAIMLQLVCNLFCLNFPKIQKVSSIQCHPLTGTRILNKPDPLLVITALIWQIMQLDALLSIIFSLSAREILHKHNESLFKTNSKSLLLLGPVEI
jgi:hypothetical protein